MATDTIAAISTPLGRGAIGIVRTSGPAVRQLMQQVVGCVPTPRQAALASFRDADHRIIDRGLAVFFPAPESYTGEDVCEFHAHGSLIVLQLLFATLCASGARAARPGEFTERAFRNGKLDLAQAEAIADLIDSRSERAARSALRTLQGEFSARVSAIVVQLNLARAELEGSIDFPDDIAPAQLSAPLLQRTASLRTDLQSIIAGARQGAHLNEGAAVAIIGAPNVGKSSLLNRLARQDKAIVSATPGTTRDVIESETLIQDLPVRLYDTAGLRASADAIEIEGIRRATRVMNDADILLLVTDTPDLREPHQTLALLDYELETTKPIITVHNKIDLYGRAPATLMLDDSAHVFLSARDGTGLELLAQALGAALGLQDADENEFVARTRHLVALQAAAAELGGIDEAVLMRSPELVAEAWRRAAAALSEITGACTSEDLLGEIFARFCLGK